MTLLNERYKILEEIGSSIQSEVYRARDVLLDRDVAIKVLRLGYSTNIDYENFRREAQSVANLSHPNIIPVYDFNNSGDVFYIVMEYISHKNLKDLMKSDFNYNLSQKISIMIQACAGIGYAHRAGLIHCDIKSNNILISRDMRVKVTDFGIARGLERIKIGEVEGTVWGAPSYLSPEQLVGQSPTPASDVYSLGVVMYELFTEQLPFVASDHETLISMHCSTIPITPSHLNPKITPEIDEIILKSLAKEPSARYRTADQLGRILQNFSRVKEQ